MAALEAMACGLPLVLTPGCNLPEVETAGGGLVVPREIGSLGNALRALLTDPERRLAMGRRARELVLDRYAWPHIVTRMDCAYQAAQARCHPQSEVSYSAD
jgi:poly(glycerol-phosphate) alpha-glucosyltransferase